MRKTESIKLLVVVVVIGALALISNASAPSVAGVALLQFGCIVTPGYGPAYGPTNVTLNSSGFCNGSVATSGSTPVPAGRLYHLRVIPAAGTVDGSIPKVTYTVYDGGTPTPITCTTTTVQAICNDFAHQYQVNSGSQIWINAVIPDSNTFIGSGSATVEETVFR